MNFYLLSQRSHSPEHFHSMHLQICTHTTNNISSIIEASIWLNSYIPSNYTQSRIPLRVNPFRRAMRLTSGSIQQLITAWITSVADCDRVESQIATMEGDNLETTVKQAFTLSSVIVLRQF